MDTPLVAVTDSVFPSLEPARQVLSALQAKVSLAEEPTPEAILKVARQADGLLVTYAKVTADIIRQLERCRVIGRFGIGVDNVDIEAATRAGIVVTYVPDYCLDEVSDHALALLLALARKIPYANRLVHAGRWDMRAVVPLHRLRGRTLGLVGFGKIPQLLAPKAQALGLKVITFDPYIADEVTQSFGVERLDFESLLRRSDYISVHAPLTPETHHLFNAAAFERMKPGALLINTARGPLVDDHALAAALDAGHLAGAALDVMPVEPPPPDSPLLGRDNVILTPHTAFYSEESLLDLQTKAAQDVARVLQGETPRYPVNPQVLEP
ncbi:MAG: C-terminal binding protein [Caldilineae bacterium]|nr:MAG: C-terminal binding protein [Caldilineae bacterium]